MRFLGEYEYRIDSKGRLAIPARFRDAFKSGLVLSRGYDRNLIAYPQEEWNKMAAGLAALPYTRISNRRVSRLTFSNAFDFQLDRQGRFVLPPSLRQYAEIRDEVVIAGLHNRLEIWSKELWQEELMLIAQQAPQIAESVDLAV